MTRKQAMLSVLVLMAIALGVLIWPRLARGGRINTSQDAKAVKATILKSLRVDAEAAYTFDTSILTTVYINDLLDHRQATIERQKHEYDNYIASLRSKQAAGSLTDWEQAILEGKSYFVRTPTPTPAPLPAPTTDEGTVTSYPLLPYPGPHPGEQDLATPVAEGTVYPAPVLSTPVRSQGIPSPTPTLAPPYLNVPYRGINPDILPPESFTIDIQSIELEGDVAKAIVSKSGVKSELVLVRVNDQWFIAGARRIGGGGG